MKNLRTFLEKATIIGVAFVLLTFVSCANNKSNGWLTDYDQALELADKQDKSVFLFVSGEDWDGASTVLRTSIFETEAFKNEAEKDFVLVQLDFSNSIYTSTEVAEDATEEEKAKAAETLAKLEKDAQVAVDLNATAMSLPVAILLSPEGYVFDVITYDETVTTPEQYIEKLKPYTEKAATIKNLVKEINSTKKEKKAAAIDALYETIPTTHRYLLQELVMQVPSLDPENTTGVVGKYETLVAYVNAIQHLNSNNSEAAAQTLLDTINNGHLNNEEKQYMYYLTASFYNMMGEPYVGKVVEYLQAAYDIAPETEAATMEIKPTLDMYRSMMEESNAATSTDETSGTAEATE